MTMEWMTFGVSKIFRTDPGGNRGMITPETDGTWLAQRFGRYGSISCLDPDPHSFLTEEEATEWVEFPVLCDLL